jgi:DNA-binding NarL/FixJ family response regulator
MSGRQLVSAVSEFWWDMRSLMAARLVLLDSDPMRREALIRALSEIGTFEIAGIATVAETSAVSPPDLYLIEGPSLSANDAGGSIAHNPFAASAIPTILMLPEPTSEQRRLALRAGYTVVLAAPAPLRLLYRRIAQLLQNARRAKRRAEFSADKRRKQRLDEVAPAQAGLLVEVSAH